jgi:hypothetical protein
MATLEITIRRQTGGEVVTHQKFELSPALAREFIAKMEAMLADLPGRRQVRRTMQPDGTTIIEFDLHPPPTVTRPTFAELYRKNNNVGECDQ